MPLVAVPSSRLYPRLIRKKRVIPFLADCCSLIASMSSSHSQIVSGSLITNWRITLRRLYDDFPRRSNSLITQIRTGHIGLNAYLYRINATESPLCATCLAPESPYHFLLVCRRYITQRHLLRSALASEKLPLSLTTLFAHSSQRARSLLAYIRSTNRIPDYHDNAT